MRSSQHLHYSIISMAHYLLRFVFLARPSFCDNFILQEFSSPRVRKKLGQSHLIQFNVNGKKMLVMLGR